MNKLKSKIRIKYIFIVVLTVLFNACNPDNEHPVPDVPVYIDPPIFIYDAEYNSLLNLYGMVVVKNQGFMGNGIVIVNIGNNEFKAYDATCPYEIKQNCIVSADSNSIILVKCNCCKSQYEITYGAVNLGPSTYPLKTYKTAFDGEYVRVYN